MANNYEPRSALFPATNRPTAPGMHHPRPKAGAAQQEMDAFDAARSIAVNHEIQINYADGSYILVRGIRRERHRRMLDFLIGYAPPIPLVEGVAFFFDRARAAAAVFGDRRQYTRVEDLLEDEMQQIQIAYRRPGVGDLNDFAERASSPLVQAYRRPYTPGDNGLLDALIVHYGYRPRDLNGLSYVELSRQYIEHISSRDSLKLCYAPALPIIFEMCPVAASIARYALSNEYLGDHPLQRVLDDIGASRGRSRETTIRDLRFGESAELLLKLGITIKPSGPLGQLYLVYDSKRAKTRQSLFYK